MVKRRQRVGLAPTTAWLLGLGVAALGCGDPVESPDQARAVHGVVRHGTTGDRLKGVAIAFRSDTLDEASDTTDGDGEYEIMVATDSLNGRLEAKKSGYETRIVSVFFDEGNVAVNIVLNPR